MYKSIFSAITFLLSAAAYAMEQNYIHSQSDNVEKLTEMTNTQKNSDHDLMHSLPLTLTKDKKVGAEKVIDNLLLMAHDLPTTNIQTEHIASLDSIISEKLNHIDKILSDTIDSCDSNPDTILLKAYYPNTKIIYFLEAYKTIAHYLSTYEKFISPSTKKNLFKAFFALDPLLFKKISAFKLKEVTQGIPFIFSLDEGRYIANALKVTPDFEQMKQLIIENLKLETAATAFTRSDSKVSHDQKYTVRSYTNKVEIIDTASRKTINYSEVTNASYFYLTCNWSPDSSTCAFLVYEGNVHTIKIWNKLTNKFFESSVPQSSGIGFDWSPNGKFLLIFSHHDATLVDIDNEKVAAIIPGKYMRLQWSAVGNYITKACDEILQIIDVNKLITTNNVDLNKNNINEYTNGMPYCWAPDDTYLAFINSKEKSLHLFSLNEQPILIESLDKIFSAENIFETTILWCSSQYIVVTFNTNSATKAILNISTKKWIKLDHPNSTNILVSHGKKLLVTTSNATKKSYPYTLSYELRAPGLLKLWDIETGTCLASIKHNYILRNNALRWGAHEETLLFSSNASQESATSTIRTWDFALLLKILDYFTYSIPDQEIILFTALHAIKNDTQNFSKKISSEMKIILEKIGGDDSEVGNTIRNVVTHLIH